MEFAHEGSGWLGPEKEAVLLAGREDPKERPRAGRTQGGRAGGERLETGC